VTRAAKATGIGKTQSGNLLCRRADGSDGQDQHRHCTFCRTAAAGTRDYPLRWDGLKANLDKRDLEVECGGGDFAIVYRDLRRHFELITQALCAPSRRQPESRPL